MDIFKKSEELNYVIIYYFKREEMVRVYLDNCCFNRPFDNQQHIKIRLETEAKLEVQSRVLLKDALHIACAIEAHCDFFLTTDKKILNKNHLIEEITLLSPIDFIAKDET